MTPKSTWGGKLGTFGEPKFVKRFLKRGFKNGIEKVIKKGSQIESFCDAEIAKSVGR